MNNRSQHYTYYLLIIGLLFTVTIKGQISIKVETEDLLPEATFTSGIEGPATDSYGNVYAVNYGKDGTIGVIYPDGQHECFMTLPSGSVGNGIRIDKNGFMYVADYTQHNVLKISPQKEITVLSHEPRMSQPNDLALTPNGNIYASDPNWKENSGQIWLIKPTGETILLENNMGTTNGIEVSPNENLLYVNESIQRKVWVYDILNDGTLNNKRLLHTFDDFGMDGMRCDIEGNLYICRYDKGTIAILNPCGKLIQEVGLKGKKPSNITFGGKDNKRCYVTLQDRGCFETFTAQFPGRE